MRPGKRSIASCLMGSPWNWRPNHHISGGFSTFCGTCAPGHFNVTAYQGADDVDIIRGRHQFGFGFNIEHVQNNTISGFNENGNFAFNGSRTVLGLADFMTGLPSDFTQTNATPDDLRQWRRVGYLYGTSPAQAATSADWRLTDYRRAPNTCAGPRFCRCPGR